MRVLEGYIFPFILALERWVKKKGDLIPTIEEAAWLLTFSVSGFYGGECNAFGFIGEHSVWENAGEKGVTYATD